LPLRRGLLRFRLHQCLRSTPGAAQQPVAEPRVARGAGQRHGADREDRDGGRIGIERALPSARQLGDHPVEHVGISEPCRQRRPGDVSGKGGEGTTLHRGAQALPIEIGIQHGGGLPGAQPGQKPVSHPDDLGEQVVLRGEVRIERATRQPGRQHDVVDVGAGMAAQPEQPRGMLDDLGPDGGLSRGADGHDMLIII